MEMYTLELLCNIELCTFLVNMPNTSSSLKNRHWIPFGAFCSRGKTFCWTSFESVLVSFLYLWWKATQRNKGIVWFTIPDYVIERLSRQEPKESCSQSWARRGPGWDPCLLFNHLASSLYSSSVQGPVHEIVNAPNGQSLLSINKEDNPL